MGPIRPERMLMGYLLLHTSRNLQQILMTSGDKETVCHSPFAISEPKTIVVATRWCVLNYQRVRKCFAMTTFQCYALSIVDKRISRKTPLSWEVLIMIVLPEKLSLVSMRALCFRKSHRNCEERREDLSLIGHQSMMLFSSARRYIREFLPNDEHTWIPL